MRPAVVVEAAAVPVDEPARGLRDELAERRDAVLERHGRSPTGRERVGGGPGGRYLTRRASPLLDSPREGAAIPPGFDRAAGWAWRLLVCAARDRARPLLLWYLKVIVLPAIVALTIAPALTPIADRLRRAGARASGRGGGAPRRLLVVAGLVAIVTVSIAREYDELVVTLRTGVDDVTGGSRGRRSTSSSTGVRSHESLQRSVAEARRTSSRARAPATPS